MILALQTIQTRELSGTTASVITVGKVTGGFEYNVIPDEVLIEGTTRALNEEVRVYLAERIRKQPRRHLAEPVRQRFSGALRR